MRSPVVQGILYIYNIHIFTEANPPPPLLHKIYQQKVLFKLDQ